MKTLEQQFICKYYSTKGINYQAYEATSRSSMVGAKSVQNSAPCTVLKAVRKLFKHINFDASIVMMSVLFLEIYIHQNAKTNFLWLLVEFPIDDLHLILGRFK
jgi:hypothetical protein